ncbi:hypothetical protein BH11BAC4_BH11BAC4_07820 [soil metagenome]
MKICFNLFPPTQKLAAILIGILLISSYTKLKAANKLNNYNNTTQAFMKARGNEPVAKAGSVKQHNSASAYFPEK